MKERPILFSAPMVRAILAGRKTQTRRLVKPQPISQGMKSFGEAWKWNEGGKGWFSGVTADQIANPNYGLIKSLPCPHGQSGDRLWVREAAWVWCRKIKNGFAASGRQRYRYIPHGSRSIFYVADHPKKPLRSDYAEPDMVWAYKHARFLPKYLSRIRLEVIGVRVQRLQQIDFTDAAAEGVQPILIPGLHVDIDGFLWTQGQQEYIREFGRLWASINSAESWTANPWVWAISFRRLEGGPA